MRWTNHSVTSLAVATVITGSPAAGLIAAAASAVPDQLELHLPLARHRGLSHDIILWGPFLLALMLWAYLPLDLLWPRLLPEHVIKTVALGTSLGILSHLFIDGLSKSGIPVFRKHRFAGRLYRTFTFSEYVTAVAICLTCAAISYTLERPAWDTSTVVAAIKAWSLKP